MYVCVTTIDRENREKEKAREGERDRGSEERV